MVENKVDVANEKKVEVIVGNKELLAKLFSEENIEVVHANVQTATFNIKTRVLKLPNWTGISNDLYDLLVSHESSHALYTPLDYSEAVKKYGDRYAIVFNIFEDARCEKKIKRKYPGLKKSYLNGYKELFERFELKKDSLLDRINLMTKAPIVFDFDFTEEERYFYEKALKLELWEDVEELAREYIDKYGYEEVGHGIDDLFEMEDSEFGEINEENMSERGGQVNRKIISSESQEDDQDESSDESSEDIEESSEESEESEEKSNLSSGKGVNNRNKESSDDLESESQNFLDELIDDFVEIDPNKMVEYINVPEVDIKKCLIPYRKFHDAVDNCPLRTDEEVNAKYYNMFEQNQRRNKKFVDSLVKEFEMKKAAKRYKNSFDYDSGELDISKLPYYKINDKIFGRSEVLRDDKSHGMILLLDCSGSMYNSFIGSMNKVISLIMFCKRVNIPFRIFGFFDYTNLSIPGAFSINEGDMSFFLSNNFSLVEFINSDVPNRELNGILYNMFIFSQYLIPEFPLRGTPLVEAVVALIDIVKNFKIKYNIEFMNFVLISDGDGGSVGICKKIYTSDGKEHTISENILGKKCILRHKKSKYYSGFFNDDAVRTFQGEVLKMFGAVTGSNVTGFYLTKKLKNVERKFCFEDETKFNYKRIFDFLRFADSFKKEGFVRSYNKGYDKFFFINDSSNFKDKLEEEELDVESKGFTLNKAKRNFMKNARGRKLSRFLVREVVESFNT